jgi:hypothetical protein
LLAGLLALLAVNERLAIAAAKSFVDEVQPERA